jgi:acetyl esterase/lipase
MDAYSPPQGTPPFPAVVLIHGGGFNSGDKSALRGESIWFAEHGYAAFSINYRLAPQSPFPAAIHDAQTAVSFIRENAARFQVNPKRIAVLGTSGGGTIAVSLGAMSGQGTTGSRVTAVLAWSPPLDLLGIWQSTTNTTIRDEITGYLGLTGQDLNSPAAQELARKASPVNMVGKSQPATFIANSTSEVIALPTAQAFVSKLKGLGVPSELLTPPSGHAVGYACTALQPSLDFLNKYIGSSRKGSAPSEESPTPEQGASPSQRAASNARPVQDQPSKRVAFLAAAGGVLVVLVVIGLRLLVFRARRRA